MNSQKNLILRCDKCKKMTVIEHGTENGIQYATMKIDEMTRPWTTETTVKHYYSICKNCLDKLIKELNEEE